MLQDRTRHHVKRVRHHPNMNLEPVIGKQRFADDDLRLEPRSLLSIVHDLVGRILLLLIRFQLELPIILLDDLQFADLREQVQQERLLRLVRRVLLLQNKLLDALVSCLVGLGACALDLLHHVRQYLDEADAEAGVLDGVKLCAL